MHDKRPNGMTTLKMAVKNLDYLPRLPSPRIEIDVFLFKIAANIRLRIPRCLKICSYVIVLVLSRGWKLHRSYDFDRFF